MENQYTTIHDYLGPRNIFQNLGNLKKQTRRKMWR